MPDSGLIGGAMGLTGGIIDTAYNVAQSKKSMEFNSEWAYRQREWALQDWNMQNEYNSPASQRQRLIDAKLSPALMYGQGAGTGASSSVRSSPSAEYVPSRLNATAAIGSMLDTYYGIKLKEAQIRQLNTKSDVNVSQVPLNKATTAYTWDRALFTESQNRQIQTYLSALNSYAVEHTTITPDGTGSIAGDYQKDKMNMDIKAREQNLSVQAQENIRRQQRNNVAIDQIIASTALIEARSKFLTESQTQYVQQQIELLKKAGILQQMQIDLNNDIPKTVQWIIGSATKLVK